MDDKKLQKLANLALVSQHLGALYSSISIPKNKGQLLNNAKMSINEMFIKEIEEMELEKATDHSLAARVAEEKKKIKEQDKGRTLKAAKEDAKKRAEEDEAENQ